MVRVDKAYRFEGPEGEVRLLELFDGRRQLIVYRFFLDPDMDGYPDNGCPGCSMFAENLPNLTHLNARDTTLVFESAGSQDAIRGYRKRMGWDLAWYTTLDDFSADFDVPEYWGINVFLRDGDQIYRSYHYRPGRRGAQQRLGAAGHHAVRPPGGVARRTRRRSAGSHLLMGTQARRVQPRRADRRQDELTSVAARASREPIVLRGVRVGRAVVEIKTASGVSGALAQRPESGFCHRAHDAQADGARRHRG